MKQMAQPADSSVVPSAFTSRRAGFAARMEQIFNFNLDVENRESYRFFS